MRGVDFPGVRLGLGEVIDGVPYIQIRPVLAASLVKPASDRRASRG
jgi:hypothetical protein